MSGTPSWTGVNATEPFDGERNAGTTSAHHKKPRGRVVVAGATGLAAVLVGSLGFAVVQTRSALTHAQDEMSVIVRDRDSARNAASSAQREAQAAGSTSAKKIRSLESEAEAAREKYAAAEVCIGGLALAVIAMNESDTQMAQIELDRVESACNLAMEKQDGQPAAPSVDDGPDELL